MSDNAESAGRQPIPPNVRRRLQQMFEHGNRSLVKGDFSYATEMFTQCVVGDPANLVYINSFLGNLYKQYNNNKKGSTLASMKGMGIRGAMKKAGMQKNWPEVLKNGAEMLKLNPWDKNTLTEMATACEGLELDECQLRYLKAALEADLKDADVNRIAGRVLGRMGKYDDAIVCWHRVQQAKPEDEEARKAIGDLAVEKTIKSAGYEDAESSTEVMADKQSQAERQGSAGARLTPEQQLEKQIKKDPANTSLYLQLAELHLKGERFDQAEQVLTQALQVSGGEINVREQLEDAQVRRMRRNVDIARKKAGGEKEGEPADLYRKLKEELSNLELDINRARCERYPQNLQYKFDLGLKLQSAKKYQEAIKSFQEARNDTQRKGLVMLHLGECFQHIEQFKLAMSNYAQAVDLISDAQEDEKKTALYRAGVLCMGLKDLDKADHYLTELAAREYGYKDVADRLDKIRQLRDKG